MVQSVNFFVLNELFLNLGAVDSPAALQGMLCGRLCGDSDFSGADWQGEALKFMDLEDLMLDEEQIAHLEGLRTLTIRLLEDANFSFSPLLPGDDASIHRRAEELGVWCQGFLHGIGASGLSGDALLSGDVADALRDLAQITQVGIDSDDDLEENEVYWLELVEYVKVAVLTVYTELSQAASKNSGQKVVH